MVDHTKSGQFVVLSKLVYSYLSLNQSLYDQTFHIVLFVAWIKIVDL